MVRKPGRVAQARRHLNSFLSARCKEGLVSAPRGGVGKSGQRREAGAFEASSKRRRHCCCRRRSPTIAQSVSPVASRRQSLQSFFPNATGPLGRRTRISSGASFSPPWPLLRARGRERSESSGGSCREERESRERVVFRGAPIFFFFSLFFSTEEGSKRNSALSPSKRLFLLF